MRASVHKWMEDDLMFGSEYFCQAGLMGDCASRPASLHDLSEIA
ncbi:hypothetical protein [uncultured Roseobacter sp.]|nr:hypothetical protein [uncultured Roseobacter sp.]